MAKEIYHDRLEKLRAIIQRNSLDGFILSTNDPFFSEYPPEHFQCLKWLTGFSGSAGTVLVLAEKALFFTDGRYTIQAQNELCGELYEIIDIQEQTPLNWLTKQEQPLKIGFDSWLTSQKQHQLRVEQTSAEQWQPLDKNPIDELWQQDRPAVSQKPAFEHLYEFAGQTRESKISQIATELRKAKADCLLLALPESICWLLNLRGNDMAYTPLLLCRALLHKDETVELYVPEDKIPAELHAAFSGLITCHPPEAIVTRCQQLAYDNIRVMADPSSTPYALSEALADSLLAKPDPCTLPKARKNDTELANIAHTHLIDGLAVQTFLHWLKQQTDSGTHITEWQASEKLDETRSKSAIFTEPSFPTISGFGLNGAIVHYRVQEESALPIEGNNLYLVDSGGQYPGGTTDITRTVAIGTPTAKMKQDFTRVLKGHIAIANAIFPKGTNGGQLDILARHALWEDGKDYAHGTGHGVGCFLGVHEGPQSISKRANNTALETGMILSNEPGYYITNEYGIRIENLVMVLPCNESSAKRNYGFSLYDSDDYALPETDQFFYFRTLTCAPLDHSLICEEQLSEKENAWIEAYADWVERELDAVRKSV